MIMTGVSKSRIDCIIPAKSSSVSVVLGALIEKKRKPVSWRRNTCKEKPPYTSTLHTRRDGYIVENNISRGLAVEQ